ncbi:DUF2569 family protein [Kaistia soli]|nr:DUF2569 family protein [Kaistia soli]
MTPPKKTRKAGPRTGVQPRKAPKKADAAPKVRQRTASRSKAAAKEPTGFGAWLWLLVIGQLLVTARMIDTLMKMANVVGTEVWKEHPILVSADLALYGAAFLLQLAVLAAMALRKAQFVPLFITAVVVYFLIGRLESVLAIAFLGMDPGRLLTRAVLVPMAAELGVGLLWSAYVLRSRRVKNTFVR